MDPARHQGAADAQRRARARARRDARANGRRAARRMGTVRLQVEAAAIRPASWCSRPRASASAFGDAPVVRDFIDADPARRSGRAHRAERRRQDHAAADAARRARRRMRARCAAAPTCRSPTTTSSASSSIRSARSSTPSARATTRSRSTASRGTSSATSATSCSRAERARSPVRALSGGERNRLLLARLFTRPANVLVLDEPTNDLDLETLELLEEQLAGVARARSCS